MIANYGYQDGSGTYVISIDTEKCNGCGDCVEACPYGVLEIVEDLYEPLGEKLVVIVTEDHRKEIKYSCAPRKPISGREELPCIAACKPGAVSHSW